MSRASLGQEEQRRLLAAARRAGGREACGLLFAPAIGAPALHLVPTPPTWNTSVSFRIRACDIERLRVERAAFGERLVGCFHSHLLSGPRPSPYDCRGAERLGGLWLIYSARWHRIALFRWNGIGFERLALTLL